MGFGRRGQRRGPLRTCAGGRSSAAQLRALPPRELHPFLDQGLCVGRWMCRGEAKGRRGGKQLRRNFHAQVHAERTGAVAPGSSRYTTGISGYGRGGSGGGVAYGAAAITQDPSGSRYLGPADGAAMVGAPRPLYGAAAVQSGARYGAGMPAYGAAAVGSGGISMAAYGAAAYSRGPPPPSDTADGGRGVEGFVPATSSTAGLAVPEEGALQPLSQSLGGLGSPGVLNAPK